MHTNEPICILNTNSRILLKAVAHVACRGSSGQMWRHCPALGDAQMPRTLLSLLINVMGLSPPCKHYEQLIAQGWNALITGVFLTLRVLLIQKKGKK